MTTYTHTAEQHAQLLTIQKQLIDLGDTKTASLLDWAVTAEPATEAEMCRGYAHLGTGQYLLNHSAAGGPAEFIISFATDAQKIGRVVGDEIPNEPGRAIEAYEMVIRIRFESEAAIAGVEKHLEFLRLEHFGRNEDREADRQRFTDSEFNAWLDEEVADGGYTVWHVIKNVDDAHSGWSAAKTLNGPHDTQRIEFMTMHRIALIPEFEGGWDAEVYGEDEAPLTRFCGANPRTAIDAAMLDAHTVNAKES